MKNILIPFLLCGAAVNSHAIVTQIVGMDTNVTNPSASAAASFFDSTANSQVGGSTILNLDSLTAGDFSSSTINIGNGISVTGNSNSDLQFATRSTNVDGIHVFSSTSSGNLVLTFTTPTTHFGFYNEDFNTVGSGLNILFDEGTGQESVNIDTALGGADGEGFFGLVFDQAISTLTLEGTGGGDIYYLDNFRVTPVPEPSSFALIAGLLGLFSIMARRRSSGDVE